MDAHQQPPAGTPNHVVMIDAGSPFARGPSDRELATEMGRALGRARARAQDEAAMKILQQVTAPPKPQIYRAPNNPSIRYRLRGDVLETCDLSHSQPAWTDVARFSRKDFDRWLADGSIVPVKMIDQEAASVERGPARTLSPEELSRRDLPSCDLRGRPLVWTVDHSGVLAWRLASAEAESAGLVATMDPQKEIDAAAECGKPRPDRGPSPLTAAFESIRGGEEPIDLGGTHPGDRRSASFTQQCPARRFHRRPAGPPPAGRERLALRRRRGGLSARADAMRGEKLEDRSQKTEG